MSQRAVFGAVLVLGLLPIAGPASAFDAGAMKSSREAIEKALKGMGKTEKKALRSGKTVQRNLARLLKAVADFEARLETSRKKQSELETMDASTAETRAQRDAGIKTCERQQEKYLKQLKVYAAQGAKLQEALEKIQAALEELASGREAKRQEALELEFQVGKEGREPLFGMAKLYTNVLDEGVAKQDTLGLEFEKAKVRLTRKLAVVIVDKGKRWILRDTVKRASFFMELDGDKIQVYGSAGKDERDKDVKKEARELEKLVEDVTEERVEGRKNLETISAMIKRLTEISNTYGG